MKVTIDSTEPLADTLRVIGALYNVTLAQVGEATGDSSSRNNGATPRPPATPKREASRRAAAGTPRRRPAAAAAKPTPPTPSTPAASTSDIRAWALANGHPVSSRGSLPAAVKAAYTHAHAS